MRKELDDALVKDFPNLYAQRINHMSNMWFGFTCGDGWYLILRELSEKLEADIVKLPIEERHKYVAQQVKEKFATMRFYVSGLLPGWNELIRAAEERSANVCERCGRSPAKIRTNNNWLMTECDVCVLLK